jgi:hypothetical protein
MCVFQIRLIIKFCEFDLIFFCFLLIVVVESWQNDFISAYFSQVAEPSKLTHPYLVAFFNSI